MFRVLQFVRRESKKKKGGGGKEGRGEGKNIILWFL